MVNDFKIQKHELDDSSSDATVEENMDDRMMESLMVPSESASNEASGDHRGSLEVPKVAVKRPPEEAEDQIESKKALWDNTEIKVTFMLLVTRCLHTFYFHT